MMKYAKIDNDKITEIHDLRRTGRTIRIGKEKIVNPREEHYIKAGWLPVIKPVMTPDQARGRMIIAGDHVTYELINRDKLQEWRDEVAMFEAEFPSWAVDILRIAQGRKTLADCPKLKTLLARRQDLLARKHVATAGNEVTR